MWASPLPDASGRRVRVAGGACLAGRLAQRPCQQRCPQEPWQGGSTPARPCQGSAASVSLSIQSEVSFEGAYGNLKRLYDKAARMHHQLKKCETRRLSPSRKR